MTISPPAVLLGSQWPRFLTGPEPTSSAGAEAVELAREAGLLLDPWQELVLERALAEGPDGRWAAPQVGVVVPRQNGKGVLLEALELAHLVLFGTELILHSAHLFVTSSEAFRRLKHLVQHNSDIERRVKKMHEAHGQEGIEFRNGQRIKFVARSRGGGRGLGGGLVVLDEAFRLFDAAMEAMYPTMAAQPNPQIWFTSSAPLREDDSDYLRRLMRRGRAGDGRLAYMEWSAEPLPEGATDEQAADHRSDPAVWAAANPGLGLRISTEYVEGELAALSPEGFDRERLGIYPEDEEPGERVIDPERWAACLSASSKIKGGVAFALDVSKDRKHASFAVAGASSRGGVHVELVDRRPGLSWVVDRAKALVERWEADTLQVAAKSPASSLVPALEEAGVKVDLVAVEDHAAACGLLFDGVETGELRHIGQPDLEAAVAGGRKRDYGDAWLWSRKASEVDISPLVAVTLAAAAFWTPAPAEESKPTFAY